MNPQRLIVAYINDLMAI